MPDTKIESTNYGNLRNTEDLFQVGALNTEGANDQKETEFMNPLWSVYYGYYKTIPELKAAIDAKATWTVGKGYEADKRTSRKIYGTKT